MDNPLFFIVLIAAVIVLAVFLPRWVRRSSRTAGERAEQRVTASRLEEILGDLGSTLVLHAPEPVAREIVDGVALQQPRKFTVLPDGGYGIRFVDPDDSLVRLVEGQDGTCVQIERFREYLGKPQTTEFWADLRSGIASAASARGVATTAGPALRHRHDDATGTWSLE